MYELYEEECENSGKPKASQWVYRNISNLDFNLGFKPPQKDTSKTCDVLKIKIDTIEDGDEKIRLQEKWEPDHDREKVIRKKH